MLLTTVSNEPSYEMESQFNRHHGTRMRVISPGDLVYIRDFMQQTNSWIPETVRARTGHVLYAVDSQAGTTRRHVNHIKRRYTTDDNYANNHCELPLAILLGTFSLPKARTPELEQPDVPPPESSPERRHPRRTRPSIQRF
ncbi:hypothetical protein PHET_09948 [Paragonimus heterotremus]|uniref:Uncharacterized protein n=1 Tax=Paragonimus heterotremus TaxID=100268 RepID=A0A8J4SZ90_9TREM|nr:hypothetical protein PHET_09948 [Paragonimus heterotremus]